jgi:[acyl-carrier-protein] S-malonyltransferase
MRKMAISPPVFWLFPGQSSWKSGMLRTAAGLHESAARLLGDACSLLGRELLVSDAEAKPRSNRDVQVGVFVATMMHLVALESRGVHASGSLGLSLGEYAHLVHIGALEFADALRLVEVRGELYDRGPAGMMAAVFPMSPEELASVVEGAGHVGVVTIANFNSPMQSVVSGERAAVEHVRAVLERDHDVEVIVIEERVPMHSPVLEPLAEAFRVHLERASWGRARSPYHPNVTGELMTSPRPADFVRCLTGHVHRPVQWRASMEARALQDAVFVEVGPGSVLTNLLQRRWLPNRKYRTDAGIGGMEAIASDLCNA